MTPLLHSMCPEDIRLSIQACPYLPHALCEGVALEAVIMSLVFNARNALSGGGVISIVATDRSDRLDGAGVVLVVASNPPEGVGNRRGERKPHVMPPSAATTVLNLATAKHFAASIGGRLVVESERSGKATIALHLPVTGNGPAAQGRRGRQI
jgi:signal transduction histidine kinase